MKSSQNPCRDTFLICMRVIRRARRQANYNPLQVQTVISNLKAPLTELNPQSLTSNPIPLPATHAPQLCWAPSLVGEGGG